MPPDAGGYTFHEVDASRWDDFEAVFEARGGPKYCWCMVFRAPPGRSHAPDNAAKKAEMQRRVRADEPVGILAYAEGEPVAWCSIAPVGTFQRLGKGIDTEREGVWALTCFFVPRWLRAKGLSRRLLQAAIDHARGRGAHTLEAYPVDLDSPSYGYLGRVPMFLEAGFEEIGRHGTRRHVMRLALA